jgi:L-lactate dehydrogenase complex protein LldE
MNFQIKTKSAKKNISLFIPCLVDQLYPEIGFATADVLKYFGYKVSYNSNQTCCGQPAFNAGHWNEARTVAIEFIKVFGNADIIVGPSGSCVAMIRNYYPTLMAGHPLENQAKHIGENIFEISEFLKEENVFDHISAEYPQIIGFHNSCHSYRELRLDDTPVRLLKQLKNIQIRIPDGEPVCCGFGGLFSFKFDSISAAMGHSRLKTFSELGVEMIATNDPGCLMHMRQEARARKLNIEIVHYIEIVSRALKLI